MPRVARIVIPGCPHHITQRGNNRQDVFFVDEDREVYLSILREQCSRFGLAVLGYCLMTNHVHLVAVPSRADSLAKAIGRAHFHYTQYVNRLHGRSGHLWQNRFHSAAMADEHFWRAMVYVERNPVRAKLCRVAWRYVWSSAKAHCDGQDPSGLLDMAGWGKRVGGASGTWKDALRVPLTAEEAAGVRASLSRGRPLGSDTWLAKMETKLNRRLRPRPVGRPKKEKRTRRK